MLRFLMLSAFLALVTAKEDAVGDGFSAGNHRRLSFTKIAGYEPGSLVTDHAAIDLDQFEMEAQLKLAGDNALATDDRNQQARDIYNDGVFSKVLAEIQIDPPLASAVDKGTAILGGKNGGEQDVSGKTPSDYPQGTSAIKFQYDVADLPDGRHVDCIVGALPVGHESIKLGGCLAASGTITINGDSYAYTYDPNVDNNNGRTIAGFSEQAQAKMYDCGIGCPHDTYHKFFKYYGVYDYAHQWVEAAFVGGRTDNFVNGFGDFRENTQIGRTEAVQKGTAYMNVWMYVIREMEDALDDCRDGCIDCNDDPVHAWDEAVAFYTGSLQGTDGSGSGVLLYELANKRCANYKTCGREGNELEGNSYVNIEIFRHFSAGKNNLQYGQCSAARTRKDEIEKLMAVPLVQGTLRYAFKMERQEGSGEKENAEGAVFAASVLPLVHHCNERDAQTIYDNMRMGMMDAEYLAVKRAFQRNYECMGITCDQVGGLWDAGTNAYHRHAEPCKGGKKKNKAAIIGGVIGGVVALVFLVVVTVVAKRGGGASGKDNSFVSGKERAGP